MSQRGRATPASFMRNLAAGPYAPLERLRLIVTNIGRKRGGQGCCGNYGEPGC